jgi:hypothetical protein
MNANLYKSGLAAIAITATTLLSADVIITEVADGTYTGQQPKFVEITNVGTEAFTFPAGGGIINQNNANTDYDVDWDMEGITLQPGQSWVVNSLTPTGADAATFVAMFGEDADEYADVAFGNGDDRYILTDGTNFLDIYGEDGIDASPEGSGGPVAAWGYQDGYAYRKAGITTGKGLSFDPEEWVFGGVDSLEADTDNETIVLAQSVLTPGVYDSGIGGNTWAGFDVDGEGWVDTGAWLGFVNVSGGDWIYVFNLGKYVYLPESFVSGAGSWAYVPNF